MSRKSKKSDEELKLFHFKKERLMLKCGWHECTSEGFQHSYNSMSLFLPHIEEHIAELTSELVPGVTTVCRWVDCTFSSDSPTALQLHINFHAFHTKLRNYGENVSKRKGLGVCKQSKDNRNLVPELPEKLECCWEDCQIVMYNPEMYYLHVANHVTVLTDRDVKCEWEGCGTNYAIGYKLRDHLRTHTQEKLIACPNCGSMYYNRTKFVDHIKRQTAADNQFECSHCSKILATERLLRDHMRNHINHHKCPKCDMTCTTLSSLANHLKYRHNADRPFSCTFCEYSAKSQTDLCKHLQIHLVEPQFKCTHGDCDYKSRSQRALKNHMATDHENKGKNLPRFKCHVCEKTFSRGAFLTRHLIQKHRFRWPSGHSRFRYKRAKDGSFQLMTIRYELIERQGDDAEESEEVITEEMEIEEFNDSSEAVDDEDGDAGLHCEQPVIKMSVANDLVQQESTGGQRSIMASIIGPDGQSQDLVRILVDDRVYAMYEESAAGTVLAEGGS